MIFDPCGMVNSNLKSYVSGYIDTTTDSQTIECGFKPSKIFIYTFSKDLAAPATLSVFDSDISTKQVSASRGAYVGFQNIGSTAINGLINSITDTGFVVRNNTASYPIVYYIAIK